MGLFAQAFVNLSNITAMITIQRPASAALPISKLFKAIFKFKPNPFAPTKEAITTIARHCIITVLTPFKISLLAVGIKTLNNNCVLVQPLISPASTTSGEILFNPKIVFLIIGGVAIMIVAIEPA